MRKPLMMAFVLLLATSGCRWGIYTKQAQERRFPTDTRQMHKWLWGEDALFDEPCCVDAAYHGHRPTCWREWQAPTTVWRDEHCGPPVAAQCNQGGGFPLAPPVVAESVTSESVQPGPTALELKPAEELEISPESPGGVEQPAAIDPPEPLPSLESQASNGRSQQTLPAQPSAVRQAAASQPEAYLAKRQLIAKKQASHDLYDSWRAAQESSELSRDQGAVTRLPPPAEAYEPRALAETGAPTHTPEPSEVIANVQTEARPRSSALQPQFLQAWGNNRGQEANNPQPRRLPLGFEIAP